MIINEPAFLVELPRPLIPRPKIVGNMMLIQKQISNKAYTDSIPKFSITVVVSTRAINA
ncbi:hypothetical protein D3C87_1898800 [compost metagenome]